MLKSFLGTAVIWTITFTSHNLVIWEQKRATKIHKRGNHSIKDNQIFTRTLIRQKDLITLTSSWLTVPVLFSHGKKLQDSLAYL